MCIYTIYTVAPFVGAWIEIKICMAYSANTASLRSSERGLKLRLIIMIPFPKWSLRSSERGLKFLEIHQ